MPLVRGRKRRSEAAEDDGDDSEATSGASASQPTTQRRRLTPENESASEAEAGDNDAEQGQQRLVKKMVRLALACEFQRRPIRRADISEKVLGASAGRRFKEVFNAAQVELRSVFGMEMVELPNRERVTIAQKRAAQKSQSQASKPTTAWILTSTLPSEFRDPIALTPTAAPTPDEEGRYTAVYTLLVSLISLSGGSLPDSKMERYLRRLGIEDNAPMGAPGGGSEKTEKLLKRMERDGYIVRIKESSGTGDEDVYWIVGQRGKVEVGERGVRGLAKAVYGDFNEEEDEELDRKIARSMGLGEGPPPGATQATEPKKKRGRPRKDEQDDVVSRSRGGGSGDDEDDESSDDD